LEKYAFVYMMLWNVQTKLAAECNTSTPYIWCGN